MTITSAQTPTRPALIGLHGFARSGKDSSALRLVDAHGFRRFAFADPMRDSLLRLDPMLDGTMSLRMLVDEMGWDAAKDHRTYGPEVRRLQQVFATEVCRDLFGSDVWVNHLEARVSADAQLHGPASFVISDVRFANEAEWIVAHGGVIWEVIRPGVGPANAHVSESPIDPALISLTICNDASLHALARRVDRALAGLTALPTTSDLTVATI